MNKTPSTVRKIIEDKEKSKIKLLSPVIAYMTLMKGFICVSILYVPKSFVNGGLWFSVLCLCIGCVMTCYCAGLLIDAKAASGAKNYTALGKHCYGLPGEMCVNFAISTS
jgi:amino acid permease